MGKFINLRTEGKDPLYIDADTITCIEAYQQAETPYIRISTLNGVIYDAEAARKDIQLADVLQKLDAAGSPLVALKGTRGDQPYDGYLSPAAVVAADISQTFPNGQVNASISLQGASFFATGATARANVDMLLDAAAKKGRKLEKFGAGQMTPDWAGEGEIYLDTSSVTRVIQNGRDVSVHFENAYSIHGFLPKVDEKQQFEQVFDIQIKGDLRDLSEIFKEVSARNEQARAIAAWAALDTLGSGNPDLLHIKADSNDTYYRRKDFIAASTGDKDGDYFLILHPARSALVTYPEHLRATFKTPEARDEALKQFKDEKPAVAKPSAAPKP